MRPLIVYGNCQAEQIATVLSWLPVVTQQYRIVHYSSFVRPPGTEIHEATPEDFATCALLVGHPSDAARPYDASLLPQDCLTVTFPPLDFNALWPFQVANLYNKPDPQRPWGAFPYGDRIVLQCVEEGRSADEALRYILEGWEVYQPNLERLFQIEGQRLRARDEKCDIKMGEHILENFREQRLFWTRNHPSGLLMRELAARVLTACSSVIGGLPPVAPQQLEPHMPAEWPFGAMQIPIHPKVAEFFGLQWYDAGDRYRMYDVSYSYAEYFEELIAHSLASRAAASMG